MKNELIELILTDSVTQKSLPQRDDSQSRTADPIERGVVVGTLIQLNEVGEPIVTFGEDSAAEPVIARSTLAITPNEIGMEAVLMFERGDVCKPIIIGILKRPTPHNREMQLDGETLVLTAEREIVLKCGKASITLTRAGKVLIRGAYLSNRSSGVNRIKGGSVQIN